MVLAPLEEAADAALEELLVPVDQHVGYCTTDELQGTTLDIDWTPAA